MTHQHEHREGAWETPHYMEKYWLDVETAAEKQLAYARTQLARIALKRQPELPMLPEGAETPNIIEGVT